MRKSLHLASRRAQQLAPRWLLALVLTTAGAMAAQAPASTAPAKPGSTPAGQTSTPNPNPEPVQIGGGAAILSGAHAGKTGPPPVEPRIHVDAKSVELPSEVNAPAEKDVLPLSLQDALAIALQRNVALIIQRYVRNQARLGILQALGIYDLGLSASAAYTNTYSVLAVNGTNGGTTFTGTTGQSVADASAAGQSGSGQAGEPIPWFEEARSGALGSQTKEVTLDATLTQGLLPSGATASLSWDNSRTQLGGFDANGNPIPLSYGSGVSFSFNQPLLRNFGSQVADRPVLLAINSSESSRSQFETQVIGVAVQVIDTYWTLVNAREQLVVAQESLQLAKDLNDRNRIQVQVGTLAPLELVQSEAAIASRQQAIIAAQQGIGDAEDGLRQLLNLPQGPLWNFEIRPTTKAEMEPIPIDIDLAIQLGLGNRSELRTAALAVQAAKINAVFQKNQELPRLDFNASYGLNGTDTNFSGAIQQLPNFRTWSVGLTLGLSIQNRSARAATAIANLQLAQNGFALDQEKTQVITEVRRAARGVLTAAQVIDAAKQATQFQEKNLDAEKKRYENGMSTSFQITQIQDQLTQARSAEVTAIVSYRTAVAEYYRTIGKLLDSEGIVIADPKDQVHRWTLSGKDQP